MPRYLVPLALVLAVAAVAPASAGIDARLGGEFRIVGRITHSNDGTRGDVRARAYRFTPLCPSGPCRKVALRREGPDNVHYRSFLRRAGRGAYKGTERSGRVICPGGSRGSQEVKLRFKIVDAEDGRATAVRGKLKFQIKCPGKDLFQKARVYGKRVLSRGAAPRVIAPSVD